jgi:hypothetical protein
LPINFGGQQAVPEIVTADLPPDSGARVAGGVKKCE